MPKVMVHVVDRHGGSVPGAHVSVPWASVPFPEVAYVADENGAITIDLQSGNYCLRANAWDGAAGEATVEVDDAGAVLDIRVVRS